MRGTTYNQERIWLLQKENLRLEREVEIFESAKFSKLSGFIANRKKMISANMEKIEKIKKGIL